MKLQSDHKCGSLGGGFMKLDHILQGHATTYFSL